MPCLPWARLLTRQERHVVVPIDKAILPSRRPRAHNPAETHRMSQSATPAKQNYMTTSSDTSRKTCFCGFPHGHGNFSLSTAVHTYSSWNTSNVTKCHACHAKPHDHIFWHVKKDTFWELFPKTLQFYPREGHAPTVADDCGRQKQGHANTCPPPDPQNVKREPFATHSGKILMGNNGTTNPWVVGGRGCWPIMGILQYWYSRWLINNGQHSVPPNNEHP